MEEHLKTQSIFCISHEPPLVPHDLFDYTIGIGDYRPTRGAHISDLDPFWDRMRPLAYGAAGNYVIPRASILSTVKYQWPPLRICRRTSCARIPAMSF